MTRIKGVGGLVVAMRGLVRVAHILSVPYLCASVDSVSPLSVDHRTSGRLAGR